ncbi:MAG: hypothetical protein RID81_22230 [Sandaracinaceae bacterium]
MAVDMASGAERRLGPPMRQPWLCVHTGRLLQIGHSVVDLLEGERSEATVHTEPLGLDGTGRLLVPLRGWDAGVACGPLAWLDPRDLEHQPRSLGRCRSTPDLDLLGPFAP